MERKDVVLELDLTDDERRLVSLPSNKWARGADPTFRPRQPAAAAAGAGAGAGAPAQHAPVRLGMEVKDGQPQAALAGTDSKSDACDM
jgi:hypothetical protein